MTESLRFHFIGGEWDGHKLSEETPGELASKTYNKLLEFTHRGEIGRRAHLSGAPLDTGIRKSVEYEVAERKDNGEIILRCVNE